VATDFLRLEVCTIKGLVTQYILVIIDIASQSVYITGITSQPDKAWMTQVGCNTTNVEGDLLSGKRYLILDHDAGAKCSEGFRHLLVREGIEVIRLPPRSPNLNTVADRFVRSVKEECLDRMIFVGQASLPARGIHAFSAIFQASRVSNGITAAVRSAWTDAALPLAMRPRMPWRMAASRNRLNTM